MKTFTILGSRILTKNLTVHSVPKRWYTKAEICRKIMDITVRSQNHLTPEIELHLITPECSLWHTPGDECPFPNPFWAFYWPGGQALSRYMLDNKDLFRGHSVLDVGSGCGASALAAALCGAEHVTANDICPVAAIAIEMNANLNHVNVAISTENMIGRECTEWDTIFLGDMFYDQEFTNQVFVWLEQMSKAGKQIYLGDPGRIYFLNHPLRNLFQKVASYELKQECQLENNGLTEGCVWHFVS